METSQLAEDAVAGARRALSEKGALARRVATDPLTPLIGLASGLLAAAALIDASWLSWVFFAAVAGYSLSGST